MNRHVNIVLSGFVPGYMASWAAPELNADTCLDRAAEIVLVLADGAHVSLFAGINDSWGVTVTPELRELARQHAIMTQTAFLARAA
jgi:uncharacterized membrane protein